MRWRWLGVLAGTLLVLGVAGDASAQRRDRDRDWILLGEKSVGFRVDRDVIRISHAEDWYRDRSFRRLHLVAEGNDIHLMGIRLVYFNGFGEEYRVDRLLREGDDQVVELRGDRSFLRQIEMTYRSRPGFGGQAVMKVYGEPTRRGPGDGPPPIAGSAPTGPSLAASRLRSSVKIGTRYAWAAAKAASRPSACTFVVLTWRFWTCA